MVRGFYFDLLPQAPGPVVRTAEELGDVLSELTGRTGRTAISTEYCDAYRLFRERYCHLEDGRATERVLERLWKR
jgi:CDP-glycerol glycerophosphotransferase